jgi:hypothetical protein
MAIQTLYPLVQPSLNLDFANTKRLDPRVTFTRASAGRVYDGRTVAKAEENLLTFSQEFDNVFWIKVNGSVTANTGAAPDGTTTADTFKEDSTTGLHEVTVPGFASANGITYTISVFAKLNSGTRNLTFRGFGQGGSGVHPIFNLSTGTIAQNGSGTWSNQTIVNVGGGWYRCSATVVASATANAFIGMADGTSQSYAGNNTSSIDLWGAQIEQRSAVTAYTPTTTQPITNYIPVLQSAADNVARFDHNPVTGESLGFLVEESRSNLFLRSEEFDNASWTKTNSTITANAIVAPDGALTGDKLIPTSGSGVKFMAQSGSVTSGQVYSFSIYVKKDAFDHFWIGGTASAWGSGAVVYYNISNGTVGTTGAGTTASINNVGNGWYRLNWSKPASATFTGAQIITAGASDANGSQTVTGDGFSGVFLWGAQLEAGAFPTSYIPTVASQVTRAADAASMTGANFSGWYSQGEGTVYWDGRFSGITGGLAMFAISDNTFNNRITGVFTTSGGAGVNVDIFANNSFQAAVPSAITPTANTQYKLAVSFATDNIAGSRNGGVAGTDTSAIIPVVDRMYIGANANGGGGRGSATIAKMSFYPKASTAAQLQALTS